jgi:hypothetical protein
MPYSTYGVITPLVWHKILKPFVTLFPRRYITLHVQSPNFHTMLVAAALFYFSSMANPLSIMFFTAHRWPGKQKKPYSAVTVQIERLTGEAYEENDIAGIVDLVEVIRIQDTGPSEAARAIRKKLYVCLPPSSPHTHTHTHRWESEMLNF